MKTMKTWKAAFASLLLAMLVSILLGVSAGAASPVARIGSTEYTSLAKAVAAVENGQTIVLEKDVTYTKKISVNRSGVSFKINMDGHTITFDGESAYLYVKKGKVTLTGKGTIKQTTNTGTAIRVAGAATLSIKNGTYRGQIINAGKTVISKGTYVSVNGVSDDDTPLITNGGTMTINGGKFYGKVCPTIYNKGTLKITAGTFTNTGDYASGEDDDYNAMVLNDTAKGKLTVTGGTFQASGIVFRNGLNSSKASIVISGGTFSSSRAMILRNYGAVSISAGSFTTGDGEGTLYCHGNGSLIVSGGTFKTGWTIGEAYDNSTVAISGGSFTTTNTNTDVAMVMSCGGKVTVTGGTFTGTGTNFISGEDVTVGSGVTYNTKSYKVS